MRSARIDFKLRKTAREREKIRIYTQSKKKKQQQPTHGVALLIRVYVRASQ